MYQREYDLLRKAFLASYAATEADLLGTKGLMPMLHCSLNAAAGYPVQECFFTHSALAGAVWLCAAISAYCLIASIVGQNCSKVDQLWSVTPWLFAWLFYAHDQHSSRGQPHPRLLLVCVCITAWGLRLTYNFWRRGGYGNLITHEEDYRWPILRKIIGHWALFLVFNITFIASYQNFLLLAIAAPAHAVMQAKGQDRQINTADMVLAGVFAAILAFETLCDQQHWEFHLKKYAPGLTAASRKRHPDPDVRDGFFQSGLWKYSRHPNYFFEQAIWVCVYGFCVSHAKSVWEMVNVYILGAVLLVLLFQGSIAFGESITQKKYSKYAAYQLSTSQCIPFFPAATRSNSKKST